MYQVRSGSKDHVEMVVIFFEEKPFDLLSVSCIDVSSVKVVYAYIGVNINLRTF